jgi:CheY-like chemotaxis protein
LKQILVADDDASIREFLIELLEANCYHVVAAVENGQEAINFLENGREADMVITDLKMPKIGGITLIRWVKNHRHNIPVILITGNAYDDDVIRQARDAGANDILGKPISIEVLKQTIKNLFDQTELS